MYPFGYGIFGFVSLIHAIWPIVLIALIVSLIVRSNGKKTVAGRVKPGEVLMDDAQAAQDEHEKNKRFNILLYVGSFFIAGSMLLLAKDAPTVMPAILIIVTLLVYGAGLILYKTVDYLQPVAIAFTYTGLVLFPIWYYAFQGAGLTSDLSLMICSIFSFFSSLCATFIIESRVAGWLSYFWLIFAGWAVGGVIDDASKTEVAPYFFFVWPLIATILPNICWSFRVKWLPVAFRKATKFFAEFITPAVAIIAVLMLFSSNIGRECPALRTAIGSLATVNGLIRFLGDRKRGNLTALRLFAQLFVVSLFADITNYSLSASTANGVAPSLTMAIVWLSTSLVQTILSLFLPQRNDEEKHAERGMLIYSLIGIFATSIFCANLEDTPRIITYISLAAVTGVLGLAISLRNKDARWSIASFLACMFIPLEIGLRLASPVWNGWIFFAIYAVLTLIFITFYAGLSYSKSQSKYSSGLMIAALIIGNTACVFVTLAEGWACAGWLAAAADLALVAGITKRVNLLEAATYLGACSIVSLIGSLNNKSTYDFYDNTTMALNVIRIHMIALPLLTFGFVRERKETVGPRILLGYLALTLPLFVIAMAYSEEKNYLWSIVFILEQVALMLAGIFTKRKWLTITAIVLSVIATLELTDGPSSIWLLLIGVGLIAFVAWQLVKSNKKPQQ